MVVGLLTAAARAACPDGPASLAVAEQALFEGRLDDASRALDDAEASFGCAVASPTDLGRFWVAEGSLLTWRGDRAEAGVALRAAARVAPDAFDPTYGKALRADWEAAHGPADADATVVLTGVAGRRTFLDGAPASFPATAPAGLHLVQAGPGEAVDFGRIVLLPPGDTVELALPALPVTPATEPQVSPALATAPSEPRRRGPRVGWVVASGATGVLAGVASGLALRENAAIDAADTVPDLQAARGRQVAFGVSAYTLMGLTAVGVGAVALTW